MIKEFHTNVKARVLYSGKLSRIFDISQVTSGLAEDPGLNSRKEVNKPRGALHN